jgi:hypothetical protein
VAGLAAAAGRDHPADDCGRGARHRVRSEKPARRTLSGVILHALLKIFLLCSVLASGWAQALQLSATRLWPSPDYTRITLEAAQPVAHKYYPVELCW